MGEFLKSRIGSKRIPTRIEPQERGRKSVFARFRDQLTEHRDGGVSFAELSAGRSDLPREAQLMCLYAGANSIFYGDKLLTTPNPDTDADVDLIRAAGLTAEAPAPSA